MAKDQQDVESNRWQSPLRFLMTTQALRNAVFLNHDNSTVQALHARYATVDDCSRDYGRDSRLKSVVTQPQLSRSRAASHFCCNACERPSTVLLTALLFQIRHDLLQGPWLSSCALYTGRSQCIGIYRLSDSMCVLIGAVKLFPRTCTLQAMQCLGPPQTPSPSQFLNYPVSCTDPFCVRMQRLSVHLRKRLEEQQFFSNTAIGERRLLSRN